MEKQPRKDEIGSTSHTLNDAVLTGRFHCQMDRHVVEALTTQKALRSHLKVSMGPRPPVLIPTPIIDKVIKKRGMKQAARARYLGTSSIVGLGM